MLAPALCAQQHLRDEALRHGILRAVSNSSVLCDEQHIYRAAPVAAVISSDHVLMSHHSRRSTWRITMAARWMLIPR